MADIQAQIAAIINNPQLLASAQGQQALQNLLTQVTSSAISGDTLTGSTINLNVLSPQITTSDLQQQQQAQAQKQKQVACCPAPKPKIRKIKKFRKVKECKKVCHFKKVPYYVYEEEPCKKEYKKKKWDCDDSCGC